MKRMTFFIFLLLNLSNFCYAAEATPSKTVIRIGIQAGGTVEWELSTLKKQTTNVFTIETQAVANPEAAKVALQSGAVDMIVTDWLWAARLRGEGENFSFYPYSTTSGALIVPNNSPIQSIKDLKGKRLGIAGGQLDKNWLLLQAVAKKDQQNLTTEVEKTFAAPPLISEQLKQQRLDAALTYWHFAARLEAEGYRQILNGKDLLTALGFQDNIPSIGYVFKQDWGKAHQTALNAFFNASKTAKNAICSDDKVWQEIIPLTKANDVATQTKLRLRFCEGAITSWGATEQQAAAKLFDLMRDLSDKELTGKTPSLPAELFWNIQ